MWEQLTEMYNEVNLMQHGTSAINLFHVMITHLTSLIPAHDATVKTTILNVS